MSGGRTTVYFMQWKGRRSKQESEERETWLNFLLKWLLLRYITSKGKSWLIKSLDMKAEKCRWLCYYFLSCSIERSIERSIGKSYMKYCALPIVTGYITSTSINGHFTFGKTGRHSTLHSNIVSLFKPTWSAWQSIPSLSLSLSSQVNI